MKLSRSDNDPNHLVEKILQKTKDELVQGIAFDSLDRMLYWTDARNNFIYQMAVDRPKEAPSIWKKLNETEKPQGIAIDVCRRKIYWTNSNHRNPSIQRASLDGSKQEIIVTARLFMPSGITVDQYSKRLFWVDDLQGIHYSVESSALDGTDRHTLIKGIYNEPKNLAVDRENVYWTDVTHNAVWKIQKNHTVEINNTGDLNKQNVQNFTAKPYAVIVRDNLLSTQTNNLACATVVDKIKSRILDSTMASDQPVTISSTVPSIVCLNGGHLNPKSGKCICSAEFHGHHCEIPICYNYCVQGQCHVTTTGYAQCTCESGFAGERCEIKLCTGYCLNSGDCTLENSEPVCHCTKWYSGRHCEHLDAEGMCQNYCETEIDETDLNLANICGKYVFSILIYLGSSFMSFVSFFTVALAM